MRFSAIWGVLFFLTVSNNTEARDFNYKSIWKSGCPQTEKAWVCDSNKNLCMAFYFMPNASEHLSVEINYDGATTNVKDCEKSIRAPDGFFLLNLH